MREVNLNSEDTLNNNEMPVKYAGFGTRFAAYLVDSILIAIPTTLLTFMNMFTMKMAIMSVLIALVFAMYKPLMEWKFGATLGKMLLNVKVVGEGQRSITFNESFTRYTPFFATVLLGIPGQWVIMNHPIIQDINSWNDYMEAAQMQQVPDGGALAWLGIIGFIFTLISALLMMNNKKSQALHDKWAGTYCIYNFKNYGGNVRA